MVTTTQCTLEDVRACIDVPQTWRVDANGNVTERVADHGPAYDDVIEYECTNCIREFADWVGVKKHLAKQESKS
jgi:hypothetical protein